MAKQTAERTDILPALTEVFREYGYEGASLALIGQRTGLGKGSLYHFFPGGKEEMAAAVLDGIDLWFRREVFEPLQTEPDALAAIARMLDAVDAYFRSGGRACLVGAFALNDSRDRFARRIQGYFAAWHEALTAALTRAGRPAGEAATEAEAALAEIQGGLVLARALDDTGAFGRVIGRLRQRLR